MFSHFFAALGGVQLGILYLAIKGAELNGSPAPYWVIAALFVLAGVCFLIAYLQTREGWGGGNDA